MKILKRLGKDPGGAAAVEMGLILGLLVIVLVGTISALGSETTNSLNATSAKVQNATR